MLGVTEPTPSGIHDLQRAVRLCGHFPFPLLVCINTRDLDPENSGPIRNWCATNGVAVAGQIPFDRAVNRALVAGRSVVDVDCGAASTAVIALWEDMQDRLGLNWAFDVITAVAVFIAFLSP